MNMRAFMKRLVPVGPLTLMTPNWVARYGGREVEFVDQTSHLLVGRLVGQVSNPGVTHLVLEAKLGDITPFRLRGLATIGAHLVTPVDPSGHFHVVEVARVRGVYEMYTEDSPGPRPSEPPAPPKREIPRWPHRCPDCGSPALVMATTIDCSAAGCRRKF